MPLSWNAIKGRSVTLEKSLLRRLSAKIHDAFVKYAVSGYFILSNLPVSLFACLFFSLLLFHDTGSSYTISLKIAGKGGTGEA